MKILRKLGAICALTTVLGMSAFAGQILTPCPQTDPGQILTPCDPGPPAAPGDMGTVTSTSGDVVTSTVEFQLPAWRLQISDV